MSEMEILQLLNLLTETEIKEESWSAKAIDNLNRIWNRDIELLSERTAAIKKEMTAHKKLKDKVETLKRDIQKINANEKNSIGKISELKSLLNETDTEIRVKQLEAEKLKQHYETRKMELSKLEKIKNLLKNHQSLYDQSLSSQLSYEGSDVFKLSFIHNNRCIGWIKFELNEENNYFKVIETEPKKLIADSILNKFHETQDTQGLLCYIYQNLNRN